MIDTALGRPRQASVCCTLAFWKLLLGEALHVSDYEQFDPQGYQSRIRYILERDEIESSGLDLTFVVEMDDGTEVPLVPGGENIVVTDANKERYVRLWCRYKMGGAVASSMSYVKDGFNELCPVRRPCCSFASLLLLDVASATNALHILIDEIWEKINLRMQRYPCNRKR